MADAEKLVSIVTSQDGEMKHAMPLVHARMSGTIANMLDDIGDDLESDIPIPNIKGEIMKKVSQQRAGVAPLLAPIIPFHPPTNVYLLPNQHRCDA